ncbi:hypothetical protein T459_16561 [Capsicum annuum]|uniref:Uncharacterized protein n=1 Tax=Capsicum annuum TaxID=4072 RepID=A0A2G2Z966_CAPAN|nr:hypothetical protein T459_16561 [Capsicum annuum]
MVLLGTDGPSGFMEQLVGRFDNSAVLATGSKLAFKSNEEIGVQIKTIPLDEVIQETERVLLIKRDVQGWEYHVLKGASNILSRKKGQMSESSLSAQLHWIIPLGSGRRRELVARASLIIATLQAICGLGDTLLEKNLFGFFPLLSSLITYEHGSNEIQLALSDMLISSVGPILLRLC